MHNFIALPGYCWLGGVNFIKASGHELTKLQSFFFVPCKSYNQVY